VISAVSPGEIGAGLSIGTGEAGTDGSTEVPADGVALEAGFVLVGLGVGLLPGVDPGEAPAACVEFEFETATAETTTAATRTTAIADAIAQRRVLQILFGGSVEGSGEAVSEVSVAIWRS